MKTVVGLYDHFEDAQRVVQALHETGFGSEDISLVARDANNEYSKYFDKNRDASSTDKDASSGAATGAGLGAVLGGLGGLLVGLGALAIPGIGPVIAAGPLVAALAGAGIGAVAGGVVGALVDLGIPEEHAQYYAEGVRRGGSLVVVRAEDQMADQAADVMNRFNPVDIQERAQGWQQKNWSGYDPNADPLDYDKMEFNRMDMHSSVPVTGSQMRDHDMVEDIHMETEDTDIPVTGANHDVTLPVIEEDIDIGKRSVDRGGVRIQSYIEETPVEEDITLRQERVNVDRRPVDRPATDADINAFEERTFEVKETGEEPVVNKRSRVVEEVHVNKDVEEEQRTIRDTVRRQDVDVQQLGQTGGDWSRFNSDFQQHYNTTYGSSGRAYTEYAPGYRYGYDLANNPRYRDYDWTRLEPEARRDWERQGMQGRWEDFRDSIRYAWDRVRGRR